MDIPRGPLQSRKRDVKTFQGSTLPKNSRTQISLLHEIKPLTPCHKCPCSLFLVFNVALRLRRIIRLTIFDELRRYQERERYVCCHRFILFNLETFKIRINGFELSKTAARKLTISVTNDTYLVRLEHGCFGVPIIRAELERG